MSVRGVIALLPVLLFAWQPVSGAESVDSGQLKSWVDELKQHPRGPFIRVQWHCHDGAVLPPVKYACVKHGGGIQYGTWNSRVLKLRERGFLIANVLAALDLSEFIGDEPDLNQLRQVLLERYLIRADDGWVFRGSRFGHRGALQYENEQDAASKLIMAMLSDPAWLTPERFLLLRESVRLLPVTVKPLASEVVRQLATDISEQDEGFRKLRIKVHSLPDSGDAARVRAYMHKQGKQALKPQYEKLAKGLEELYGPKSTLNSLKELAGESKSASFRREMANTIKAIESAGTVAEAIAVTAARAQVFRKILLQQNDYSVFNRLRFLRASLILEEGSYALSNKLLGESRSTSRAGRLQWLGDLAVALHASGLLSDRQWQAVGAELKKLNAGTQLSLAQYHAGLRYLERVTQWAQRAMEFQFGATATQWQAISPLAQNFVPDRLRNSPLLPYTRILDSLISDASSLSGVSHSLFGREIATGIRALNPGVRRGTLLLPPKNGPLRPDGIYILESTRQELTPVAGILTRGEGSSVSHVQLLARNLGIPNLVIDDDVYKKLRRYVGRPVVVAVSHRGVVSIERGSARWNLLLGKDDTAKKTGIRINQDKLDLSDMNLKSLLQIRAVDSGRTVGPKTANLGELYHYYPDLVNPGIAIPFGFFRKHLDQPFGKTGMSVFAWMKSEFERLAKITHAKRKREETSRFLARLRTWIIGSEMDAGLKRQLKKALGQVFGEEGTYGLFVRSDTNVEDLPEFTGAGLNLTVPNVVGFEPLIKAILRVWASPFTERSYAWRQSLMYAPEHTYPAVLLMKSFDSEKSGVMVTSDIENGDRGWLSIAVNEGVGGAVEGQMAEEIRVNRDTGALKLLAQASAVSQASLDPAGGIRKVAASGSQQLLDKDEIRQLIALADDVERRFPLPKDQREKPVVADIEFGFRDGKLALFQIRPFVESHRARHHQVLLEMDRKWDMSADVVVSLSEPPLAREALW